jgi:(R,R)-butanediol dehydrogenase/meso-butanediol dehydrogenase/diacetyl reductase
LSDSLAVTGLSWAWGGFGEYAVVNDYNAIPIPDGVTDVQAALIEPAAVAVYAVGRAGIRAGDSVLVTGAGPIGQLVAMAARTAGASKILLSDTNENRLALARDILEGVTTVNPRHDNVAQLVRDSTESGAGVDAAIECAGHGTALGDCIEAVRRQGVVVQLGLHVGAASVDAFTITRKDIDLRGSWCYSTLMWPRVASLLASGQLPAEKIVTKRIKLPDIVHEGFEALIAPDSRQLKILVDVG